MQINSKFIDLSEVNEKLDNIILAVSDSNSDSKIVDGALCSTAPCGSAGAHNYTADATYTYQYAGDDKADLTEDNFIVTVTRTSAGYQTYPGMSVLGQLNSIKKSYDASTGKLTITFNMTTYHINYNGSIINCYSTAHFNIYKI